MAKQLPSLDDELTRFIEQQHIFFVGTAARTGRVNVSPKGMDSLRILGPNQLVWLNYTGSGNETAGHLLDSNRMTLMFCSFDRQPLILRLYGSAETIHQRDAAWQEHIGHFTDLAGARQLYLMQIDMVQTSCGFAVPFMDYADERPTLKNWAEKLSDEEVRDYWEKKNRVTIDNLDTQVLD